MMKGMNEPSSNVVHHLVRVRFRNRRWEVSLDGVTRPLVDWLFSRERATEHALELARAIAGAPGGERVRVVIEAGAGGAELERIVA